jgi:transcriptional regulator of acetoin/glycerol metabolism
VTFRANAALRFFAVARRPATDSSPAQQSHSNVAVSTPSLPRSAPRQPAQRLAQAALTFKDPRLSAHLETARRVIARQTPVLLCGETGSGKEVFARAVHEGSPHSAGAFVAINCASLPETLIESELFGYRAGAFTGAQRAGRRGKILQADGGTLFLDEIADMPLDLQARLLRVLDERQVTPLGTEDTHAVDFQLISASHQRLPELVREGRFREDLYYRLSGIELQLPALRERSDKRELIQGVLESEGGTDARLGADAERLLMDYAWPGNIRQLRHVLRTAAALADSKTIKREHLPALNGSYAASAAPAAGAPPLNLAWARTGGSEAHAEVTAAEAAAADTAPPPVKLNPIQANERQVLLQMLVQHRWNVSNVAKALDVSRNTLYRKLHKLHIEISHPD